MDEILNLFYEMVVDIQGFNQAHFGIFPEHQQEELTQLWTTMAHENPNKFIALLSPEQKKLIAQWAVERTSFPVVDMISALENFTKFLKQTNSSHYPPVANYTVAVTKERKIRTQPRKLKGWKKVVYTMK
jgi:hypothetical protein